MVNAGVEVAKNSVVGARSTVTGDVPAHHVVVGQPAKAVRVKPGFEDETTLEEGSLTDNSEERELEYTLSEGFVSFDEFERPPELSRPTRRHRER